MCFRVVCGVFFLFYLSCVGFCLVVYGFLLCCLGAVFFHGFCGNYVVSLVWWFFFMFSYSGCFLYGIVYLLSRLFGGLE